MVRLYCFFLFHGLHFRPVSLSYILTSVTAPVGRVCMCAAGWGSELRWLGVAIEFTDGPY